MTKFNRVVPILACHSAHNGYGTNFVCVCLIGVGTGGGGGGGGGGGARGAIAPPPIF